MGQNSQAFEIQASFETAEALTAALLKHDSRIERVDLGEGITLTPLFVPGRTFSAVGTHELLAFAVTVSGSVAGKVAADVIYKWFTKTKAQRLRVEKTEIFIQDGPDRAMRVISEIIEKGSRE